MTFWESLMHTAAEKTSTLSYKVFFALGLNVLKQNNNFLHHPRNGNAEQNKPNCSFILYKKKKTNIKNTSI